MQDKVKKLRKKANWVRKQVLEMIAFAGKGHIGGALSCTDILAAIYYGGILRFEPSKPGWEKRDRFILSKGHACSALYAILSDLGYFPSSELRNYQGEGSILGGHPNKRIPGIEADTGSLGHGLGIGAGLALSAKLDKKDFMTIVLLGDGECHEGTIWEAAMFAAHHKLSNLFVIIDNNSLCSTDFTKNCLVIEPLEYKWKAFGWDVMVIDGHSFAEILSAFSDFRSRKSDKPLMIIAKTVKGKGISFMEGNPDWHHAVPNQEQLEIARKELEELD